MIAVAFLCLLSSSDCEKDYITRAVVGSGKNTTSCTMDGWMGLASHPELEIREGEWIKVVCK